MSEPRRAPFDLLGMPVYFSDTPLSPTDGPVIFEPLTQESALAYFKALAEERAMIKDLDWGDDAPDAEPMPADKYTYRAGDLVVSQCALCRHLSAVGGTACAAFPGTIPAEILANEHDHRRPWIDPETGRPGDGGMAADRSILFEPRHDANPASLEALRRHFARASQA